MKLEKDRLRWKKQMKENFNLLKKIKDIAVNPQEYNPDILYPNHYD